MTDRSQRSEDASCWDSLDALQGRRGTGAGPSDSLTLFDQTPQPLWIEDWSGVKTMADGMDWPAAIDPERHLLDSPDLLHALHERVLFVDMNAAALAFYGTDSPALLADTLRRHPPQGSLEAVARMIGDLRAGARGMDWEQEGPPDADGRPRWIRAVWYMPPDARPDWSRLIFSIQDVTRQRHAEHLLAAAKAEADEASRAKSEFLANVSHELRTPLHAIAGFSELLLEEKLGPLGHGAYREYARYIRDGGEHLLDLINDLLDLSRVEAGVAALKPDAVDVRDVVEGASRIVQDRARRAGLQIALDLPRTPLTLVADARKLRQIVVNLLSNAIKYTPPGGRVTIEGRALDDGGVTIVVRDTGLGMRLEDIPTAMERFGRIDGPGRPDGVGLGLPLTKALIELHGGTFSLDSVPGEGTVARVRLPSAPPA